MRAVAQYLDALGDTMDRLPAQAEASSANVETQEEDLV
jgi:hypothetical protein